MASPLLLFDAAVFDLDGTLVATDRFWVAAARAGAKRAFAELGIERAMPTAEEWMSLVGLPLHAGFQELFSDLDPQAVELVLARCSEEERFALKAGEARLLPGAAEALSALRERGVLLGIASNCGRDYLEAMMGGLALGDWIGEARCLDSPHVHDKAGMVADLLETFGTRSAVMIGDRATDREAAHANGLPYVHSAQGFAREGEGAASEAVIDDLTELVPRLERRTRWIEASARALDADWTRSIGVTGRPGSGKTLFARDLARVLAARGREASVVALDAFRRGDAAPAAVERSAPAADRPLEALPEGFDVDDLVRRVLEPHARGEDVAIERAAVDPAEGAGRVRIDVPKDSVLVLEGPFLLHPLLGGRLDRVVHLSVSESLSLRRIGGRDARLFGPESLMRIRRHDLPVQRAFEEACDPAREADLVLDAENALGPP